MASDGQAPKLFGEDGDDTLRVFQFDSIEDLVDDDRLLGGENMFGDDGNDFLRAPPTSGAWGLDGGLGTDKCVGDANDRYTECEVIRIRP